MNRPRGRTARLGLGLLLVASAVGCQTILSIDPSTYRVVVVFDPQPNAAPPLDCTEILSVYTATWLRDETPACDVCPGVHSVSGAKREMCSNRTEPVVFPDNSTLKQGYWAFQLDVIVDGTPLFSSTCEVWAREGVRYVLTFTQMGRTATCTGYVPSPEGG
jgi:hypothetical protein